MAPKGGRAARDAALAQTADIDRLFKTVAEVSEAFRQTRLALEKSVKSQKEAIKERIVHGALEEFREHLKAPCAEFIQYGLTFSLPQPAFGDAVKGLKTRASIEPAAASCLTDAKVAIDAEAREARVAGRRPGAGRVPRRAPPSRAHRQAAGRLQARRRCADRRHPAGRGAAEGSCAGCRGAPDGGGAQP